MSEAFSLQDGDLERCEMAEAEDAALAALGDPPVYPDPPPAPSIVNLSATYQWKASLRGYTRGQIVIAWPQRLSYSRYEAGRRSPGAERWRSESAAIELPDEGRRRLALPGPIERYPAASWDVRISELALAARPSDYAYARLDFPSGIIQPRQSTPNQAFVLARTADSLLVWCVTWLNFEAEVPREGSQLSATVGGKTHTGPLTRLAAPGGPFPSAYLFIDGLTADTEYNFPLNVTTGNLRGPGEREAFAPGAQTATVQISTRTLPAAGPLA